MVKRNISLLIICVFPMLSLFGQQPLSGISMLKNSKWPSQSNGKTIIKVSWENPSSSNAIERQWVEEAIESSWEKYANIDFVGWGKSSPGISGIRIIIDDYGHPHTKGLGTDLDGRRSGMLLNFNFQGRFKCTKFSKEDCIKFIAVHEFGHALGLAHEHNRTDCLCNEDPQGGDGDFFVTPCDLESVMNYCNPRWSNHGKLSRLDIIGIQRIYGEPSVNNSYVNLDEIRLIPCRQSYMPELKRMKGMINSSGKFKVIAYSEELNPVPQRAIDNLPNARIVIRFFHPDDEAKVIDLKDFLVQKGYARREISIENMLSRMSRTYPKYIEIWSK